MKYAKKKHSEQKVPSTNSNKLLHISNAAMEVLMAYHYDNSFDINFAIQIAILHDTIEDIDTSFKDIKSEFREEIAKTVVALTKIEQIPLKQDKMVDSLSRINKLQKEVGLVKIADRITNLQTPPSHCSHQKIVNYCNEAKLISKTLSNKNDYLNKRLDLKIKEYEDLITKSQ
ncbi:HD domain-containing protein [Tenacibaculum ovolyticum]|uniref:HD domain-containing protein n=1 Tax=Tenacibaculum ovolyticum TaxID=104270 RepID=UPI003BAA5B31